MTAIDPKYGSQKPSLDRRLATMAAKQHGVVSRRQLLDAGFAGSSVDHRVFVAKLHVIYRGVYAVGHPALGGRGRWMAAVLACGPSALLSHRSAAALWDLLPTSRSEVEVIAPGRNRRCREGILVHQARSFDADCRTVRDGIPITTVSRTLIDLAAVLDARRLERALEQAERLQLLDVEVIRQQLERNRNRRGTIALRSLLAEFQPTETRSELERQFLDLCREAELPLPHTNVVVAGFEVDAVWFDQRLVVELDGYAFHRSRRAFESDRRRDGALQLLGFKVLRLTSRRLVAESDEIARMLRDLLI